jgi:hypothetical protein
MDLASIALVLLVLSSFALGLAPILLPAKVRLSVRWALALLLFATSLWVNQAWSVAPEPYHLILLVPFWLAWAICMIMLPFHPKAKCDH